MGKVTNMGKHSNNGALSSVESVLKDAIDKIGKKGAFIGGKKILILCLDDTDDQYQVSFIQAGMAMSECIALCEVGKSICKNDMGY